MQPRNRALLMSLGAIVCWSFVPIMIHYVKEHFTVLFGTFARYLASLVVLWPLLVATRGPAGLRREVGRLAPLLPRVLVVAVVNYTFQTTYTLAFYTLYPGFATLLYQTVIIFSVLLALIFFPDERRTLRSPWFVAGLAAAVAGVVLTVAARPVTGEQASWVGLVAVFVSSLSWALLGTLVKKWLGGVHPLVAITAVFSIVTPLFLLTHVGAGGGWPAAPSRMWVVMLLSGLVGVGLGHPLHYAALPVVGVTVTSGLGLLIPLLAGVMSFLFYGERLLPLQFVGGALLLAGCYVVVRERFRRQ